MPIAPTLETICKDYLTRVRQVQSQTNATDELSYRDALGQLLRESAEVLGKNATWTGEAKKLAVGRPDYAVTDGLKEIGYVEAESISADLNHLAGHAKHQNDRFKQNLHSLLLTNHLDFQLWVGGNLVETARFSPPPAQGSVKVTAASLDEWERLLSRFLSENVPSARSAEEVARQLAKRAKELRYAADILLSQDDSALEPFFNAYKQTLYADLSKEKFADVYAQTFTYGLFLAWLSHAKGAFTPGLALSEIPQTVPPIKVLLDFGGGNNLPDEFAWIVAGICSDLDSAVRDAVMKPFSDGRDPIMHFYETFLAAYDPKMRESRGVYYTPDSVVEFIVRAVDDLLRDEFGKSEGLADPTVTLLDPAVGTATFLAHAYKHVHDTMTASGAAGQWPARAEQHVAKHFYGFELLPAAYTLAHIKLRALLMELKAPLPEKARLPVYLTNTLDEGLAADVSLPFLNVLSKEAMQAKTIKNQNDVLVVMGNPPYSGHSANPSKNEKGEKTYIGKLLEPYFSSDGQKLNERNPKWLQDDYVKFLRFAEDRIERTGQGVVAFVTNHGYLDNPTFRGMRRHLMNTFDRLYFYDLHGNSLKKERAPDGGEDKNVFDIQQGVAICILVKLAAGKAGKAGPIIKQADLFGTRSQKSAALLTRRISDTEWTDITPTAPAYLFVPQNQDVRKEYERGKSVKEIFPLNGWGIATRKDYLLVDFDQEVLVNRFQVIGKLTAEDAIAKFGIKQSPHWRFTEAKAKLSKEVASSVFPVLFRPFDTRYVYYEKAMIERGDHRWPLMRHMLQKNLALITVRGVEGTALFDHVLCTSQLSVLHSVSMKEGNFVFPLYRHPEPNTFDEKQTNLAPAFVKELMERLGHAATPEDTFHYLYAVLHSPTYRERYGEFLKRDFPRIPLPPDADTFALGAEVGKKLVAAHLLEDPTLLAHAPGFLHSGPNIVDKMKPDKRYNGGKVWLNATQNFDNVTPDVWQFRVGGYQPAAKWLDDRAGRPLSDADITHYRRLLAAQRMTLALLPDADAVFARILAAHTE